MSSGHLRRATEGIAVLAALAVPPVALVAALHADVVASVRAPVVALVVLGAVSWGVVALGVTRLAIDVVRCGGASSPTGPLGWAAVRVAALVLVVAPFLEGTGTTGRAMAAPRASRVAQSPVFDSKPMSAHRHLPNGGHRGREGSVVPLSVGSGSMLAALGAVSRRSTRTHGRLVVAEELAVDVETALLAAGDSPLPTLSAVASALAADGLLEGCVHLVVGGGEARLDDESWRFDPGAPRVSATCLAVILGEAGGATHVVLLARGGTLALSGPGAADLVGDAVRVAEPTGLGVPVLTTPSGLLRALAVRDDGELVVCVDDDPVIETALAARCALVSTSAPVPFARCSGPRVELADGRVLAASSLSETTRALLDGSYDEPYDESTHVAMPALPDPALLGGAGEDVAVVRLLTAVPRVDGLAVALESGRERRGVELVAYLALHAGEPITGERLRVRVLGSASTDAAAKTLFNVASGLRRALGEGRFGQRLPPAGRFGHYGVAPDVVCDVAVLEARVGRARSCVVPEERIAWLRAALELIESEPFATVLAGYDWFLTEGHLTRLQVTCEDAACALVDLCVERGLLSLASWSIDRARLVDPYSEGLAAAAVRLERARQASFEAIAPAERSTVPSEPAVT